MEDLRERAYCAAKIVSAYVTNNYVTPEQLTDLITTLMQNGGVLDHSGSPKHTTSTEELKPAVPISQSIKPDYIVCLEDGMKFKILKRHLWAHYQLTPDQYRKKWNLPDDYPMVAPNYSVLRRTIISNR